MPLGVPDAARLARLARKALRPDVFGIALGVLGALFLIASEFPAGGNDDSHITYWVAHALSTRGQIANYNGFPVEQSSSLALVLLLGLCERVTGLATPVLGWSMSLLFGGISIALVPFLGSTDSKHLKFWSPILLGSWAPFLYWSTSGMEMTLVTALGCAVALLSGRVVDSTQSRRRRFVVLALLGATFVLARPEAPIEIVCMLALGVAVFVRGFSNRGTEQERQKIRRVLVLLSAAVTLVLVVALVRWLAFGMVAPNPALAKSGAFALADGASYLWKGIVLGGPAFALVALLGTFCVAAGFWSGRVATPSILVFGWGISAVAFVVGSGGDWMPGARLLVPIAPALAVLAGEALGVLGRRSALAAHAAGAVVVALNVTSALSFGASGSNGSYRGTKAHEGESALIEPDAADFSFSELANRAHRRDARLLGPLLTLLRRLKPTADDPIYLMSGQAGMVPYYVFREFHGKVRFIDLYALTTPEILPCIPSRHRKHQVQGIRLSAGYVIDHADDMDEACGARRPHIVFSTGRFPEYLSKRGYERFYQGPAGMDAFVAVDRDTLRRRGP
jgi:hypothetical protein